MTSDYRAMFDSNPDAIFILNAQGQILNANLSAVQRYGYSLEELRQMNAADLTSKDMKNKVLPNLQKALISATQFEWSHRCKDGSELPVEIYSHPLIHQGEPAILSSVRDITILTQARALLNLQNTMLEVIATGVPLQETLTDLILHIEALSPGMLGSILLLDDDGVHVRHGAAPSLPPEFIAAVDSQPIGPCAGSCGTAAFHKKAVFVDDIATHPLWDNYKAVALPHGLHACWSTPIFNTERRVLGTFAMYYKQPGLPETEHLKLIEIATHIAAIAINHSRAEMALRDSERKLRNIVDGLGPSMFVGLLTTNGVILEANEQVLMAAGLTQEDVLGKPVEETYWFSYSDESKQQMRESVARAAKGEASRYDMQIRVAENQLIPLDFSIQPFRDTSGTIVSLVPSAIVITERKQAEQSLRESETMFRTIIEASPVAMVMTDELDNFTLLNRKFVEIFGYTLTDIPTLKEWWPCAYPDPDYRMRVILAWQEAVETARREQTELEPMEWKVTSKDGTVHHIRFSIAPMGLSNLVILYDLTEKKETEERIERLAHFDHLTGLPNRSLMNDRFKYVLSLAQRLDTPLVVMFLDLDHFKNINDTLGHSIGDKLLIEIAMRIKTVLREEDILSRQGGDEFILVLYPRDVDGAAHVAAKLIEAVSQPCKIEQEELIVTSSIGIAMYPHDGEDFETLSKHADAAMYRAKQDGRNGFCYYTPEMQTHSARALQLANALRHALERNELQLHYQPQLSIQDGHIIGAEALLRWQHPKLGMISPAEFIPIAEDSGQIISIGEWVLRTATKQMKDWIDGGLNPMVIAVNLSSVQFRQANITQLISHILDEVKLPHEYLELELTEAVAMDDPVVAIEVMDKLFERGIRMSIDDFGTGYSSLSYLKKFKVYKLKIDQSFVRDITEDPDDKAIVSAIINLASSLGIKTIAEGVETSGQLAFLRLQGCDEVQGYYFSKPLPAEQFEAYAKTNQEEL